MQASNPNNTIKYQTALGAIHVKSADCRNAVHRGLGSNLNNARVLVGSQGIASFIPASRLVTMSKQPNVFLLQPPSEIAAFEDLSKN